jgi:hypothetical protein
MRTSKIKQAELPERPAESLFFIGLRSQIVVVDKVLSPGPPYTLYLFPQSHLSELLLLTEQ